MKKINLPLVVIRLTFIATITFHIFLITTYCPSFHKEPTDFNENEWALSPNQYVITHESDRYIILYRSNGELVDTLHSEESDIFKVRLTDEF